MRHWPLFALRHRRDKEVEWLHTLLLPYAHEDDVDEWLLDLCQWQDRRCLAAMREISRNDGHHLDLQIDRVVSICKLINLREREEIEKARRSA